MTEILVKLDGLKALQRGLREVPKAIPGVTSRAINAAVDREYTESWDLIKSQYYLQKKRFFAEATRKVRANPTKLVGALVATGKNFALSRFKFSPTRPRRRGKPPNRVSVNIGPSISATVPAGAFIATMRSGVTGVFARRSRSRFPIYQPLADVGPAQMLGSEKVRKEVESIGNAAFEKEFTRLTKVTMDRTLKNLPK